MRVEVLLACLVCAGAAAAQPTGQRLIPDAEAAAFNAVGRVNVAGNRHCTGVLISDRLALTAAHCLYNSRTGRRAQPSDIKFVAGLRRDEYAALRDVAAVATPVDYVYSPNPSLIEIEPDIALLALAEPVSVEEAAPMPPAGWVRSDPVSIVAYGQDRAYAASIREGCGVVDDYMSVVALDCAVTFGVSGAPVLAAGPQGLEVVAVVSAMSDGPEGEVSYVVTVEDWMAELLAALEAQ